MFSAARVHRIKLSLEQGLPLTLTDGQYLVDELLAARQQIDLAAGKKPAVQQPSWPGKGPNTKKSFL